MCSVKKLFLEIWPNFQTFKACNFMKKRLQDRCFPVKTAKFLRTPFLKDIRERLLSKLSVKH